MLREMYYGRVIPWERKFPKDAERVRNIREIEETERAFVGKLSEDEKERFQQLSDLYAERNSSEEGDIFSYGFAMGALMMMDIMNEAEAMKIE